MPAQQWASFTVANGQHHVPYGIMHDIIDCWGVLTLVPFTISTGLG